MALPAMDQEQPKQHATKAPTDQSSFANAPSSELQVALENDHLLSAAGAAQSMAMTARSASVSSSSSSSIARAVAAPAEEEAMNMSVIDAEEHVSEVFPLSETDFQMNSISQLSQLSHIAHEHEQASDGDGDGVGAFQVPNFLHRLESMNSATSSSSDAILFAAAPLATSQSNAMNSPAITSTSSSLTLASSSSSTTTSMSEPTTSTTCLSVSLDAQTNTNDSSTLVIPGVAIPSGPSASPSPPALVHYSRKEDKMRQIRQHPAIISVSSDGREVMCKCRRRVRLNPPWYIIKFEQHMASRNCSLLNAKKTRMRNGKRPTSAPQSVSASPQFSVETSMTDPNQLRQSRPTIDDTDLSMESSDLTEATQSLCSMEDVRRFLAIQDDSEFKQKQSAFCDEISQLSLFSRMTLNGKFVECKCTAIIVLGGAWKLEKFTEHVTKQLCKKPYKKRVRKQPPPPAQQERAMPTPIVTTTTNSFPMAPAIVPAPPAVVLQQNELLMTVASTPIHKSTRKRPLVVRWNAIEFKNVPPCPGLRDERFSLYAQNAVQLTGGNRPRHVIARELFPSLFASDQKSCRINQRLSRSQREFLHDVTQQEALWFVDKEALCVRSLECKGMVDTSVPGGHQTREACSNCEALRFNTLLRNSMTTLLKKPPSARAANVGANANTNGGNSGVGSNHIAFLFEQGELRAMDSKSAKLMRTLLRMNIDEDSVLNHWLDFAEMGMDGAFDSHPAFLGLVDSMTKLKDKAQRGVGLQNMAYNNALDAFMGALGDISMASAELFQQHLCGRITSKGLSSRKRKREDLQQTQMSQVTSRAPTPADVQSEAPDHHPIGAMESDASNPAFDASVSSAVNHSEALPLTLSLPTDNTSDANPMLLYESTAAQTERLVAMLEASADAQNAAHAMMPSLDIHDMDLSSFSSTPSTVTTAVANVDQAIYSSTTQDEQDHETSTTTHRHFSVASVGDEETANMTTEDDQGSVSAEAETHPGSDEVDGGTEQEEEQEDMEEDQSHDGTTEHQFEMSEDRDATVALAAMENGKQLSEQENAQVARELVIAQVSREHRLVTLPCTGLRDDKVAAYVAIAAQVIGGSRPRYVIAKELFPQVFPDHVKRVQIVEKLDDAQRLLLQDTVYRECLWRVDKVGKCVRSLHCERTVERNKLVCNACRHLKSHGNFRSVLSRAKRAPPRNIENLKFVPSVYTEGDPFLRKISKNSSFRGLYLMVKRQLAPETARESQLGMAFWLKVAVMGLRGEFHSSLVFEGLVQSMMELKDKERRGVGKQNMQYSKALDDFMNALAATSMEAFELFAAQFCGRTVRSQKVKHRREKDQPPPPVVLSSHAAVVRTDRRESEAIGDAQSQTEATPQHQLEETTAAVAEVTSSTLAEDFFAVDHRRLSSSEMEESQRLMDHMLNEVRLNLSA